VTVAILIGEEQKLCARVVVNVWRARVKSFAIFARVSRVGVRDLEVGVARQILATKTKPQQASVAERDALAAVRAETRLRRV
jgi:hypothetical protein